MILNFFRCHPYNGFLRVHLDYEIKQPAVCHLRMFHGCNSRSKTKLSGCHRIKGFRPSAEKRGMYINTQPPPALTLVTPVETPTPRGTESQPLKLQPYQIVRATVVEGGLDKVVLNVKNHKLSADTRVPLKTGQKLHLQVLSTHPQIHLRIMEAAELKYLFRLLHSLGQSPDLTGMLRQLQSGEGKIAASIPADMQAVLGEMIRLLGSLPGEIRGGNLARLWDGLGLNLEALLAREQGRQARAGLKSALLVIANEPGKQGATSESVERLLEQFTLFQFCRHILARENVLFLPLPFSFLEQGYLLAEQENREGLAEDGEDKKQRFWKMTLNLALSKLGNLHVKLLFEGRDLHLRILCDSDDKVGILSGALPRLQGKMTTVILRNFSVGTGAENPATALVRRLAPDGNHFLEVEA